MKLPRDLPPPLFVRTNDFLTLHGAEYIIKRNEFSQMVKLIGRVSRRLPSEKDVIWALRSHRPVAFWGGKYFMFERIDDEIVPAIMEQIWEVEAKRGVPKPDLKDEEDVFTF